MTVTVHVAALPATFVRRMARVIWRRLARPSRFLAGLVIACVLVNIVLLSSIVHWQSDWATAGAAVADVDAVEDQEKEVRPWAGMSKRFWTSDLHDGGRGDLPSLLMDLGHKFFNMGLKRERGPFPEVIARMTMPSRPLAPTIDRLWSHSSGLRESDVVEMFEYYKDDPVMYETDAFLCLFPASYCEIFMPFNRTIIFNAAHRLFLGRCSTASAQRLVDHLRMMLERRPGHPRHFVVASGRYDVEYIKYFMVRLLSSCTVVSHIEAQGIEVSLVSTSGFGYALNKTVYTQSRPEILIGPLQAESSPYTDTLNQAAAGKFTFIAVKALYRPFRLQDIANHRAVVIMPKTCMSWGISDIYALGVPMFVPSIPFLMELKHVEDLHIRDGFYCGPNWQPPPPFRLANGSTTHPFSPEDLSVEAQSYWLQYADYYQWPHIATFSSWAELITLLETTDLVAVHHKMMAQNVIRLRELQSQLTDIADQIDGSRRVVPKHFESAIRSLWNVSRLMVD